MRQARFALGHEASVDPPRTHALAAGAAATGDLPPTARSFARSAVSVARRFGRSAGRRTLARRWLAGDTRRRTVDPVCTRLRDEITRPVQRLEGPRVRPPAVEDLAGELATPQIPVVDVGDLELAPARRLQGADHVEDLGVVEVDAGDRVVALRSRRLLLDRPHTVAVELGDPESLCVRHLL